MSPCPITNQHLVSDQLKKKQVTLMSSKVEPKIWSGDTGQWILCFDKCQLTITWMCNIKGCYKPMLHVSVQLQYHPKLLPIYWGFATADSPIKTALSPHQRGGLPKFQFLRMVTILSDSAINATIVPMHPQAILHFHHEKSDSQVFMSMGLFGLKAIINPAQAIEPSWTKFQSNAIKPNP